MRCLQIQLNKIVVTSYKFSLDRGHYISEIYDEKDLLLPLVEMEFGVTAESKSNIFPDSLKNDRNITLSSIQLLSTKFQNSLDYNFKIWYQF